MVTTLAVVVATLGLHVEALVVQALVVVAPLAFPARLSALKPGRPRQQQSRCHALVRVANVEILRALCGTLARPRRCRSPAEPRASSGMPCQSHGIEPCRTRRPTAAHTRSQVGDQRHRVQDHHVPKSVVARL